MTDPRELLDLITEKAEGLRAAGVQALEFDGVKISLSPPPMSMASFVPDAGEVEDDAPDDPLDDPTTFGLSGKLPGAAPREPR